MSERPGPGVDTENLDPEYWENKLEKVYDPSVNKPSKEVSLEAARAGKADLDITEAASLADQTIDPAAHAEDTERRERITKATNAVGEANAEVLRERYALNPTGEGPMTQQDIADHLPRRDEPGKVGVSLGMVQQRLRAGLARIRISVARNRRDNVPHPLDEYDHTRPQD